MDVARSLSSATVLDVADTFRAPDRVSDGSLIDSLLDEQGDLSAVERFAQFHEHEAEPLQGRYYSSLMPTNPPRPGQQYAFEVDLDRCSGCKACVAACHTLNGLDEGEAWRDVGLIVGGAPWLPILQHVTSSCHHCLDPACLNACPVDAYEKDPITGIVKHLDDQCFGCQYCTLACPYDAPKFHPGKGIVRKCDMCGDRLKVGEAPACVQACPHEAIRIRVVAHEDVVASAEAKGFLTAAPDPGYTLPTTRYLTSRPPSGNVLPADHHRIEPEHAHVPLVVMLVLTQLSVGGFLMDLAHRSTGSAHGLGPLHLALSLGFGFLGLAASTCHLGRPLYAYRALIGLRHSWLSREVVTFGLFAMLALASVALGILDPGWWEPRPTLQTALAAAVVAAGVAGVASSVMVYHVVRRPFWRAEFSGMKFAGTVLLLGLATSLLASSWSAVFDQSDQHGEWDDRTLSLLLMAVAIIRLLFDASILTHLKDLQLTPLRRSALLICGRLARPAVLRLALGVLGGFVLPMLLASTWPLVPPMVRAAGVTTTFLSLLGGELAERYLFFAAVTRPKMPGGMLP